MIALRRLVPDGLVASNWGGTDVEAWSSPEAFAKYDAGFAAGEPIDNVGDALAGQQARSVVYI